MDDHDRECMGTGVLLHEDRRAGNGGWASCVPSQHFALGIEDEKNNHRLGPFRNQGFQDMDQGKLLIYLGFSSG